MDFIMFLTTLLMLAATNKPDTNYYHEPTKVETRQKVAIIDTGIELNRKTKAFLCYGKHYDFTGYGVNDEIGHGTNIAGIISKNLDTKKQCLLIIKYFHRSSSIIPNELKAFRAALNEKVIAINFSSGGPGAGDEEPELIKEMIKKHIYFVTAAGNDNTKLTRKSCNYYPACYNYKSKYFKVVGNGKDGNPQQWSNYGEVVTDWRNGKSVEGFGIVMSGTSQSTAIRTSEIVGEK